MRVSILKQKLIRPPHTLETKLDDKGAAFSAPKRWGGVISRVPVFKKSKETAVTKVLDKGFFFPRSKGAGAVPFRGLIIRTKKQKAPSIRRRRAASYWEILEGAKLRLGRKKYALEVKQNGKLKIAKFRGGVKLRGRVRPKKGLKMYRRVRREDYSSSLVLRCYTGVKGRRLKKRLRWKKLRRLRVFGKYRLKIIRKLGGWFRKGEFVRGRFKRGEFVEGPFRRWKRKRLLGFKRPLRLLPRRGRRVPKKYRLLRYVKKRPTLIKGTRFSRLKTRLAWSKGLFRLRKLVGRGARNAPLKSKAWGLNPLISLPDKGLSVSKKLTYQNAARFKRPLRASQKFRRSKAGTRRTSFRIPQTRYKPGLSKWWRLLRLQFCLAWGLPWLRQRRFTNYISQLTNVTGLGFLKMCLSSVGFVVRTSFLVRPKRFWGDKAFVNGRYVVNPFFQVYKGDRLVLLTPPLPSNHRWKTFTKFIRVAPLRGWEVDGLTRSVSIWSEPSINELRGFVFKKPAPFLTFRMYNWKYRH